MFTFFIYGTLTALFALIAEILSGALIPDAGFSTIRSAEQSSFSILVLTIFILAALEEGLKYLVLRKTLLQNNGVHTISASLLFGIGFAVTELALIFLMAQLSSTVTLSAILGILAVHIATAGIYGYSIRRKSGQPEALLVLIGISLHAAYNLVQYSLVNI
jgi:RsiW-degrading membrane proteinase PrsW (M82 family)